MRCTDSVILSMTHLMIDCGSGTFLVRLTKGSKMTNSMIHSCGLAFSIDSEAVCAVVGQGAAVGFAGQAPAASAVVVAWASPLLKSCLGRMPLQVPAAALVAVVVAAGCSFWRSSPRV